VSENILKTHTELVKDLISVREYPRNTQPLVDKSRSRKDIPPQPREVLPRRVEKTKTEPSTGEGSEVAVENSKV